MQLLQHVLLSLIIFTVSLSGQANELKATIPETLKPWIPWVLQDQPQHDCPFFYTDFLQKRCSGSGILKLDLQNAQGQFSGESTLYTADWLLLPGDLQNWPQRVLINQTPAVITEQQGKPAIWLPPGHYQFSGAFYWESLPKSLAMSPDTGLIQLSLNHKPVLYPRMEQGAIWLDANQNQQNEALKDVLDLQVFRQVIDDNPLQILTRLEINVSGKARELTLQHALLADFIPIKLDSPLAAKLEQDGRLLLQVRPGHWIIDILARHPESLSQLNFSVNDPGWPSEELWVFQAVPALRLVEIEHLPSVDASQTNLPQEWAHLPAYRIQQGQSMGFKLIRRGDPEPEPNQLSLRRKLWLDFDGRGYSVNDQINGKMTRDWRLNAAPEVQLGQVLINGQNQLITQFGSEQGVEVRRGDIQLLADSRIKTAIGQFNAVGWQQAFQQVQTELNLPPGWRLLAVSGTDNDPDSWLNRWSLLDLFLMLITALSMARLWSLQWGLIALLSLVLFWHEADAPRWIWLNNLAAQALVMIWPQNKFLAWIKSYRNICLVGLVLIVIPFMVAQMRVGIYPQLEKPWQPIQPVAYSNEAMDSERQAGMPMAMPPASAPSAEAKSVMRKPYALSSEYTVTSTDFKRIDPESNLQTGPGLPQWQWQTVQLAWNGAVDSQQRVRIWYLSPTWNLILHIAQVLMVALLSLKMLGVLNQPWRFSMAKLSVWLILPFLMVPTPDSLADIPDQALLEQLRNRLLEAPKCLPNCASLAMMTVTGNSEDLQVALEIHAQETVAVPLPVQLNQWLPEQVTIDEKPAQGLFRLDDGLIWLLIEQGVHKVQLSGRHRDYFTFSLPLRLVPQYTKVNVDGWRVDGLFENGKTAEQLQFTRLNDSQSDAATNHQISGLPAFVRVERILQLGLDWQVTTRVVRLENNDTPIVLKIPLLTGESVRTEQIRVENQQVLVNMAAGTSVLEWQSMLEKSDQITLKAPKTSQWTEIWRADVSPIWHLEMNGIAVVHHQDQQGVWLPEWRPWPGEEMRLKIQRPQAVPGPTLTIDKSQLQIQPGKRNQTAELSLDIRSSKGGQHALAIPSNAVLQSVSIDGINQPIRQKAETVTLPIRPGAQHVTLNWQSPESLGVLMNTPAVNLGVASVNSHIQAVLGQDRWVLFTFGPKFGPAVLFWGLLIVILMLAMGLARVGITPLKTGAWFLLLIGLSQIHIAASLLVVVWLFALGWRAIQSQERAMSFNFMQIILGLLTIASLFLLFAAVQQGLLGDPDMQITGNQSTMSDLKWYQDHSEQTLPSAGILSVPMMVYRLAMLAWSLWMAVSLLNWLRWGWNCFSQDGLWKQPPNKLQKAKAQDEAKS